MITGLSARRDGDCLSNEYKKFFAKLTVAGRETIREKERKFGIAKSECS